MLGFLLDENTEPAITSGLRRRDPMLAVWRVGELTTLPLGTLDPDIPRWCEQHNCVLVTNNRHSMPNHLREHVREGGHIPGILTINALTAANSVLIPVQCEYYAMEGLTRLIGSIDLVRQSYNPGLEIEGIALTMFDSRISLSRQVADQVRSHFTHKVYQAVIPRNVALAEAPSYGRPGILYNMASSGSQSYVSLAKEFIVHGEKGPR